MLDIFADLIFGESFYGLEADNEHSWILGFILGAKFASIKNSLSRWYSLDKIFGWGFFGADRLGNSHRCNYTAVGIGRLGL